MRLNERESTNWPMLSGWRHGKTDVLRSRSGKQEDCLSEKKNNQKGNHEAAKTNP